MIERLRTRVQRNAAIVLVFVLMIVLFIAASFLVSGFGSTNNARNILIQAAVLAIVAAGQTFVIIGAGIDLSVPWTMTLCGVLTALLTHGHDGPLIWVLPVIFSIAAGIGLVNGIGVSILNVPPIIMTLATNVMLSGAVVLYVGTAPPSNAPPWLENLAFGEVLGIPLDVIILAVTTALATILLTLTPFGRRLYAIGTSQMVSRFSGVQPVAILIGSYVLCSIAAAAAGLVLLGYVGTAYTGMGDPYQFASIAAVIVGGASVLGGNGHYIGTLAGALLLTVLNAMLIDFNLGAGSISIFYGLTILVSVWLTSLRVRRTRALQ